MKKMNNKDYLNLSVLTAFILGFVIFLRAKGYLFGSDTDWISQHVTIPEYFRMLFYETGNLIPTFNMNLGLGQNIFYFAYYGFLSPWLLISYLFPFVKMINYIQVISIINMVISTVLIYRWIYNKTSRKVAMLSSIIFILSGPLLFHSHRHIMFVNYMPFLLGSLLSVDLYFKKRIRIPLIINTFLMIMTSFYFSVPSIIVIGLYSLYLVLENNNKITKDNFKPVWKIVFYVIIAILLSGVILLPTGYALFAGRSDTNIDINILKLFIPTLDYKLTFYYSYSLGLTFIYVVSLVYGFMSKKKENIFLNSILFLCIVIPALTFLLNNFMYIDGKCFIPFLPLALIVISCFLDKLFKNEIDLKKLFYLMIPIILIMVYGTVNYNSRFLLLADIFMTILFILFIAKFKKPNLIFIPIIIISLLSFVQINLNEVYVPTKEINEKQNTSYKKLLNEINNKDFYRTSIDNNILNNVNKIYSLNQYSSSIYSSTSNKNYINFNRNIFKNEIINKDYTTITQTSNILYNIYTGTKYLITDKDPLIGYEPLKTIDKLTIYENNDILPVGYSSSKIMSLREFNTLSYPHNIDALLNYVIVNKSLDNVYSSKINIYDKGLSLINYSNLEYNRKEDGNFYINAQQDATMNISLNSNINNEILILSFKMNKEKEGKGCSTDITINGINNSLSCSNWKYHNNNYDFEYVLSSNKGLDNLEIEFSKGEYEISDIQLFTMNYDAIKNLKNNISEFVIDSNKSNNNTLVGTIDAKEDGYFKLTIPYEKRGFSIYVDGIKTSKVKIDDSFLGFEIIKGHHNLKITYQAPLLQYGVIMSLVGTLFFILTIIYPRIKKALDICFDKINNLFENVFKKISLFLITNRGYVLLFLSMFILDFSLRIFYYHTIKFFGCFKLAPNLFSIFWIVFLLLFTYFLNKKLGKIFYLVIYIFSLIMFLVHAIYYSYFNLFFDYSVIGLAEEGATYLDSILLNIKWWVIATAILSVYLTIKGLRIIDYIEKFNIVKIIKVFIAFVIIHFLIPLCLGNVSKSIEWDDWRNPRSIYSSFNDSNKGMMIAGMYEYNLRNFYVNFIRNNDDLSNDDEQLLKETFSQAIPANINNYTGVFAGKNLIIVQLESIDDFLVTPKIMPTTYKMMKNSINFTDHYSFTSGGGSTFNSEFMVNTGYSSAYNYNQNAYSFSRNNYNYSLPNLFRNLGYTSNAYHMNTLEYYSRGVNYKSFGYDNYYGLKDLPQYAKNTDFWLDRELILNEKFNSSAFNNSLSLSYFITYSAHMPFKTSKGTCSMLTEEEGLTEYECLKLQAGETDNFMTLLLDNLEKNNMLDNTVIVAFADHYVYTLEDSSLLDKLKKTDNNLINHTPFFIWSNGQYKKTIKKVNSQLDILPTILNLFGVNYYSNYYLGDDILDKDFNPLVFFPDASWYNGETYVANGEYRSGKKISDDKIHEINSLVKNKMSLNDAVMKSNYFSTIDKSNEIKEKPES